jgi:hypothetical protein
VLPFSRLSGRQAGRRRVLYAIQMNATAANTTTLSVAAISPAEMTP